MSHVLANLKEWHEFYVMLGAAAAALLALLFVAVSVAVGFVTNRSVRATRTFVSPVVVHFTTILTLSAVALAPPTWPLLTAAIIGIAGIVGVAVAAVATVHTFAHHGRLIEPFDRFAYGVIPAIGQIGIVIAAGMMIEDNEASLHVLAGALLLLLLVSIRNAWDLVLTIVREQERREKGKR
jgi:hypothetical protein